MTDSDPIAADITITGEDIVSLNRATVLRASAFARIGGSVLLVVGVLGMAAWLWVTVRYQQNIDGPIIGGGFDAEPGDPALIDRIDVFASTISLLMYSALAAGAGLALRVVADYAVARTGGSLTGFEVGDHVSADEPDAS